MIYTLENDRMKVQINSLGAELWSVIDKNDGIERIWQGDPAVWDRRAPNLFPHCGRLKDNQCTIDGSSYQATIHGFCRDYEHQAVQQEDTSVTFCFAECEETLMKYPYRFRLYTRYELTGNKLLCSFRVENTNHRELPFSIGYHTGYVCPFDHAHSIEDYSLVFEKKETAQEILCDENGLITGEEKLYLNNQDTIPLSNELFASSFILTGLKSEYVSIVENATGRAIRVGVKDFPYVVFWSTPKRVPFVCIEPWYGLPDRADTNGEFAQKPGIQKIGPGQTFSCAQSIEFIEQHTIQMGK
jgi:galactose mutarotase-like enzyme